MQQQSSAAAGRPRWWLRDVLFVIVLGVVAYFESTSGLFNFKAASEFASRDIFYRAWGVSYPAGQSNAATVVLFSDKSLGKNGSWPTPYETHAAFLRSLLALRPAAVMIDIGFIDERKDETINNFVDALKSYYQRGIPVFLAGASRDSGAMRPVRAELQALAADRIVQLVSIETGHELGRLSMYPVVETRDGTPPASVAVRKTLCEKGVLKNCEPLKDLKEFEIWWGAKPNPLNCTNATPTDNPCAAISPGPGRRLINLTWNWFVGEHVDWATNEPDPIPLPYPPTTSWDSVVSGQVNGALRAQIQNSVVFYGLDLALINDEVYSPVHGLGEHRTIPGVFFHAMAYDNLVNLGANVIRPEPPFGWTEAEHMALLILTCAFVVLLGRLVLNGLGLRRFVWVSDWVLYFGAAFSLAIAEFQYWHISPANWIGIIFAFIPLKLGEVSKWTDAIADWLDRKLSALLHHL